VLLYLLRAVHEQRQPPSVLPEMWPLIWQIVSPHCSNSVSFPSINCDRFQVHSQVAGQQTKLLPTVQNASQVGRRSCPLLPRRAGALCCFFWNAHGMAHFHNPTRWWTRPSWRRWARSCARSGRPSATCRLNWRPCAKSAIH